MLHSSYFLLKINSTLRQLTHYKNHSAALHASYNYPLKPIRFAILDRSAPSKIMAFNALAQKQTLTIYKNKRLAGLFIYMPRAFRPAEYLFSPFGAAAYSYNNVKKIHTPKDATLIIN
jgi:hypothetical protein